MMRLGIESVVNWHAIARGERLVGIHDGIAAAVSENNVVARDERPERVTGIHLHALDRRRSIDIEERDERVRRLQIEYSAFEQFVEHTNPAAFYDEVGAACLFDRAQARS